MAVISVLVLRVAVAVHLLFFLGSYRGRDRHSPDYFDESEPDNLARIFVALFDYDPQSMSPNPDATVEELPFKEGQIIKVGHDTLYVAPLKA